MGDVGGVDHAGGAELRDLVVRGADDALADGGGDAQRHAQGVNPVAPAKGGLLRDFQEGEEGNLRLAVLGGFGDPQQGQVGVGVGEEHPVHREGLSGDEGDGGPDSVLNGVVVGDGQPPGGDEEAAAAVALNIFLIGVFRVVHVQLESGGHVPVRHLPGGELFREKAPDLGLGAAALVRQALGQGSAVLGGEGQGVQGQLVQVPQGEGFAVVPGGQGRPAGEEIRVFAGEALIPQQPQQRGAKLGGGQGLVLAAGDGDPALGHGVVLGAGGQIGPDGAGEADQQVRPVEPVGGAVQNLVGGHGIDQAEAGQGSGGPAGFSLQGGGGGNRAQKQDQGAEQGKDSFFHGISLHQEYSSYCSTVKPALQVGKRGHLPTGQAADGLV